MSGHHSVYDIPFQQRVINNQRTHSVEREIEFIHVHLRELQETMRILAEAIADGNN
jgi:hypothetical protein